MINGLLIAIVKCYRLLFKAWIGASCRFEPSCSAYALDALQLHGPLAGSYLVIGRLVRCHPGCSGGCDPVPLDRPRLFGHLLAPSSQKKSS